MLIISCGFNDPNIDNSTNNDPTDDNSTNNNSTNDNVVDDSLQVDSDGNYIITEAMMNKQSEYKTQWLENIKSKNIIGKDNMWEGISDLWGGGGFGTMNFFFDEYGNFWNSMDGFFAYDEVYLKLLQDTNPYPNTSAPYNSFANGASSLKTRYLNGHTAVVYIVATTSGEMEHTLYLLQITNNNTHNLILKTKNAWGWNGRGSSPKSASGSKYWDDKTIPQHEMVVVASNAIAK